MGKCQGPGNKQIFLPSARRLDKRKKRRFFTGFCPFFVNLKKGKKKR